LRHLQRGLREPADRLCMRAPQPVRVILFT
jgi:hypothetical protein